MTKIKVSKEKQEGRNVNILLNRFLSICYPHNKH